MKSGSLNLLETSGPVRDCNGIDLPLSSPSYDRSPEETRQISHSNAKKNKRDIAGIVLLTSNPYLMIWWGKQTSQIRTTAKRTKTKRLDNKGDKRKKKPGLQRTFATEGEERARCIICSVTRPGLVSVSPMYDSCAELAKGLAGNWKRDVC